MLYFLLIWVSLLNPPWCSVSYSKMLLSIWFQDLLFLACSHSENRSSLTQMEEWPEWLLEVLISSYEVTSFNIILKYHLWVVLGIAIKSVIYTTSLYGQWFISSFIKGELLGWSHEGMWCRKREHYPSLCKPAQTTGMFEIWHLVRVRGFYVSVAWDLICFNWLGLESNPNSMFAILHYLFLQMDADKHSDSSSSGDIEDLIHNFLIIMLEHSMRQKDGWKVRFMCVYIYFLIS